MSLNISLVKQVISQLEVGTSQRTTASALSISKSVVRKLALRIQNSKLSYQKLLSLPDSELNAILYPKKTVAPKGSAIDWASVDEQLKNKHVNLLLIYEYLRNEEQHIELSYSHFCHLYRKWKAENKASHPVHINMTTPGEKLEIDYSGDNVVWIDKHGRKIKSRLFTACFPYSSILFAYATADETAQSWCEGLIKALEYFGGSPKVLIVDNARALVQTASKYEGIIAPLLDDITGHYGMECWSCGPGKPIQKNRVEASVNMSQTWVQGQLELESWGDIYADDLAALNKIILKKVDAINLRPFADKSLHTSRIKKFLDEEFSLLVPLPTYPYEICEWKVLMVDKSHCVRISQDGGHRYSVPIDFIHKAVFVRLSHEEVQIYSTADNKLIGRHVRQYSLKGEKTHLLEEHMTQAEKDRRRSPEYFIEKLTKRGVLRKAAEDFVYGSWGLSGDFVSRQRLHAIVRNLLPAYRPSLLSEALADAAEYKQFKYNFVQELLKQKEELLSRQIPLTFELPDESYKTPNHTNIRNNYE